MEPSDDMGAWDNGWCAMVDPLDVAAATIPQVLGDRAVFPVFQPIMELATGR